MGAENAEIVQPLYLESAEKALFDRFLIELDAGDYYDADKVISLMKRLEIV